MAKENVKVKLIDTRYVETDSGSFKSVVQRLTGKDSSVGWIEESSFGATTGRRKRADTKGIAEGGGDGGLFPRGGGGGGLPLRDFELPSVEDLKLFWTDVFVDEVK